MRDLNILILLFAAILIFTSGYILGVGQNIESSVLTIKQLD